MDSLSEEKLHGHHTCKGVHLSTSAADFYAASSCKDTLTYFRNEAVTTTEGR